MKNLLPFLFIFFAGYGNSQIIYEYCFDQAGNCYNGWPENQLIFNINNAENPNNSWQIGPPQKSVLSSSFSSPNVIITDTVGTYPINDTSSFTIEGTAFSPSSDITWFWFDLSFKYFVDSDTLIDFGIIEFSPDNGVTWIDLINDASYSSYLDWEVAGSGFGSSPILTGTSNGWKEAYLTMRDLGVFLDIQPGTTFMWRFSFISDAVQNNRDGLMFDNIKVQITPPVGLEENYLSENKKLVKVIDLLGRETEIKTNNTLIYVFDDGSTEKVFKVE